MKTYKKGAKAERELSQLLKNHGYYVVRSAKSGNKSPDILGLKKGNIYAFEVKAHAKDYLSLRAVQMEELKEWFENTGIEVFVAWRIKRGGFYLIRPEEFKKGKKGYNIKIDKVKMIGRKIYDIL